MPTSLSATVQWIDLPGVNAYIVDDEGTRTLVDAGMPWHRRRLGHEIAAALGSVGDVDRILITHFDPDHVGALGRIDHLDAPIHVGEIDAPYLTGDRRPSWTDRKGALQRALEFWRRRPENPIEAVADGDTIGSFTAYHTPGHTSGHTVFVSEGLGVAVLGDLVYEIAGELRPPRAALSEDPGTARRSVIDLAERVPDFEVAAVGHGTPFKRDGSKRLGAAADRLRSLA